MPMDVDPVVGAVYEDSDGRTFEVAAFDENEATVQLRFDDGSTEEIDLDAWFELDLEEISVPEASEEDDEEELKEAEDEDEDLPEEDDDEDDDYYNEGGE
jgi:hypothetical protein